MPTTDRWMEWLSDERMEPHVVLAAQLIALAVVAVVLFLVL